MSFPVIPTAGGQIIPGVVAGDISFGGITFDPCAAFTPGSTAYNICKGISFGGGGGGGGGTPITAADPGRCGPGFSWSALLQSCIAIAGPTEIPGSEGFTSPAETGASMHGPNGHADSIPSQREIRRRVCGKGMGVLGKDGWCHKKIANKDRAYPKPRKALGTPGELNALATSKKFAKRLVAAEKGIKETARDLARAGGIKLGGK